MGVKKADFRTIGEYLEFENSSDSKHEYENGRVLAMSGGTFNHGILCSAAYREISNLLEAKGMDCTPIGSEVRVHIEKANSIVYPDTMVICGEIQMSEQDSEAVINPMVIVEVLSKSTESYDRGDKFYKYGQLASFKEYILIHQDSPTIESFYRKEQDYWQISRTIGLSKQHTILSLDIAIDMQRLYQKVNLD